MCFPAPSRSSARLSKARSAKCSKRSPATASMATSTTAKMIAISSILQPPSAFARLLRHARPGRSADGDNAPRGVFAASQPPPCMDARFVVHRKRPYRAHWNYRGFPPTRVSPTGTGVARPAGRMRRHCHAASLRARRCGDRRRSRRYDRPRPGYRPGSNGRVVGAESRRAIEQVRNVPAVAKGRERAVCRAQWSFGPMTAGHTRH